LLIIYLNNLQNISNGGKTMGNYKVMAVALAALLLAVAPPGWTAGTWQDFDTPGTNYTLFKHYGSTPASIQSGGPSGNFVRLNYAGVGGSLNTIAFDRTQAGPAQKIIADFDFRMYAGTRADGIGFVLLNTATYGTSGASSVAISEEANAVNSLGIGFDIFNNWEDGGNNHLSLHYNNTRLQNFPLDGLMDLWSSTEIAFDHAHIVADLATGKVSVALTPHGGSPIQVINNFAVPGLSPYEARVAFGARTGGSNANHDIDNINVAFVVVPVPGAALLLASGLLALWPKFRKRS
jgi:hypothetical protein